ncbi:hypothetical protein BJ138DRAFT_1155303, partial [Hygrophoropsis aurantiaca]
VCRPWIWMLIWAYMQYLRLTGRDDDRLNISEEGERFVGGRYDSSPGSCVPSSVAGCRRSSYHGILHSRHRYLHCLDCDFGIRSGRFGHA